MDSLGDRLNPVLTEEEEPAAAKVKAPVSRLLVWACLGTVVVLNASYNVITKHALKSGSKGGADPLIFSLYRDMCAYPILQVAAWIFNGFRFPRTRDIPLIALLGLTGMFGNQYLFILGLQLTSATFASVTSQMQTIFATLLSLIAGQIQLSVTLVVGVVAAFSGSLIMGRVWCVADADLWECSGSSSSGGGGGGGGSPNATAGGGVLLGWQSGGGGGSGATSLVGDAVLFGGSFAMALYYVLQKPLLARYPPLTLTAWSYFWGAAIMGLASLFDVNEPSKWRSVWASSDSIGALCFAITMNSVAKYALQSYANKWTGATTLTVWSSMVPLVTAAFAFVALHETLSWSSLGGILTLIGVALVSWLQRKTNAAKAQAKAADAEKELLVDAEGEAAKAEAPLPMLSSV